jgi:transcriptional regulator with XRE-family HTH domain
MSKKEQPTPEAARQPARQRDADQVARHAAIRERFQREKPSLEQLVSTGEYNEPLPMGEHLSIRQAVFALRKAREEAGLSLADVAERSGIDKAALSRIETGQNPNPTVSTLCRYAQALGKRWVWGLEDDQEGDAEAPPADSSDIDNSDHSASDPHQTGDAMTEDTLDVPRNIGFDGRTFLAEPEWRTYLRRMPVRYIRRPKREICQVCGELATSDNPLQSAHRIGFGVGVACLALTPEYLDSEANIVTAHRVSCNRATELSLLGSMSRLRALGVRELPGFLPPEILAAWKTSEA